MAKKKAARTRSTRTVTTHKDILKIFRFCERHHLELEGLPIDQATSLVATGLAHEGFNDVIVNENPVRDVLHELGIAYRTRRGRLIGTLRPNPDQLQEVVGLLCTIVGRQLRLSEEEHELVDRMSRLYKTAQQYEQMWQEAEEE